MKQRIAICEEDSLYRERFLTYLLEHKSDEMEVFAFSDKLFFEESIGEESYDLALLGKGFLSFVGDLKKRKVPALVLMEESSDYVAEANALEATEIQEGILYTSKYQPMDRLLHEMQQLTGIGKADKKQLFPLHGLEIVGVCSPVNHEMQVLFSMLYATKLAKERKVLYINFLEYVNYPDLFEQACIYDISDLVLQLRNETMIEDFLKQCMFERNQLYYIPPLKNPENISEILLEDVEKLVAYLGERTDFDTVIIDFGGCMEKLPQMLSLCRKVFCLTKEGYLFQCQMEQFFSYLKCANVKELQDKIQVIKIPFQAKNIHGGGNLMEQLNWSEFGDFVRNLINGGAHDIGE